MCIRDSPETITEREILDCLREATISGKVVPMMCGSAFKNKGVQAMLDMVMEILPSPLDIEAITGTNPDTGEEASRQPSVSEPFSSLAFKIATDPFVGRLCFTRAYSGQLNSGSYVLILELVRKKEFLEFSKCMLISKTKFLL